MYQMANPSATKEEYVDHLYSEVTFEDFLKIMRMAAIDSLSDPETRHDLINAPGWSGLLPEQEIIDTTNSMIDSTD